MFTLKEFTRFTFLCVCTAYITTGETQRYVVDMADIVCRPGGVRYRPIDMTEYLAKLNRSTPDLKEMLKLIHETKRIYMAQYSINVDDEPGILPRLSKIKFPTSRKAKPLVKFLPKATEAVAVMHSYMTMAERILQDDTSEQDQDLYDNIENIKYELGNWSSRFDSLSQTLGGKRMSPKVCKKPIAPRSTLVGGKKIEYFISIFKNSEKVVDELTQLFVGIIDALKDCQFEQTSDKLKCKRKRGDKDSKRRRKKDRKSKGKTNKGKRRRRGCNKLSGDEKKDCRKKREDRRKNKNKSRRGNRI